MKNYLGITLLLLFITLNIFGQESWYTHQSSDFSVLFPKKVSTRVDSVASELGTLRIGITMYDATSEKDDNLVYAFYETAYPDSVVNSDKKDVLPRFFRGAIDGSVKRVNGKLLSEKEIELNGFPGREIKVSYNEGDATILMRCYLVHHVMLIQQVVSNAANDGNAATAKFLNSLKLK